MHAGVVNLRFSPDKVDEVVRTYQDLVLPELKEMRGFKDGYMLTDAEIGKSYVIGFWETREDAEGFESEGSDLFRKQSALFGKMFAALSEPPSREVYEVSVQA